MREQQQDMVSGQENGNGDGYLTPSSALDAGVMADGAQGDPFPMEWTAALLEDISGYGLFGLSDDFLMQDMFASASGSGAVGDPSGNIE